VPCGEFGPRSVISHIPSRKPGKPKTKKAAISGGCEGTVDNRPHAICQRVARNAHDGQSCELGHRPSAAGLEIGGSANQPVAALPRRFVNTPRQVPLRLVGTKQDIVGSCQWLTRCRKHICVEPRFEAIRGHLFCLVTHFCRFNLYLLVFSVRVGPPRAGVRASASE